MKKGLFIIIAVMVMLLGMSTEASAAVKVKEIKTTTNLMKDTADSSAVVAVLAEGTDVQICTSFDQWYGVKAYVNGKVKKGYVKKTKTESLEKGTKLTVLKKTPLKSGAKSGAKTIKNLAKGTEVTLVKVSGTWVKVQMQDKNWKREGWVSGLYLKKKVAQQVQKPEQQVQKPEQQTQKPEQVTPPVVKEPEVIKIGWVNNWHLNLRKEPSTNAEIVIELRGNDRLELLEYKNYWYKVIATHEGKKYGGYVWGDYVSLTELSEKKAEELGQKWITEHEIGIGYVNHSYLNMRDKPSMDGKIIEKLGENEQILVLEDLGGWYKVKAFRDPVCVDGYVAAQYIWLEP